VTRNLIAAALFFSSCSQYLGGHSPTPKLDTKVHSGLLKGYESVNEMVGALISKQDNFQLQDFIAPPDELVDFLQAYKIEFKDLMGHQPASYLYSSPADLEPTVMSSYLYWEAFSGIGSQIAENCMNDNIRGLGLVENLEIMLNLYCSPGDQQFNVAALKAIWLSLGTSNEETFLAWLGHGKNLEPSTLSELFPAALFNPQILLSP
jgi:hypothetical protein